MLKEHWVWLLSQEAGVPLPLSTVAGVVTLVIGVTDNIEFPFNWLKESKECELVFPSKFHGCASACSLK